MLSTGIRGDSPTLHRLGKTREVKAKSTILRPLLIDDKPYVTFRFFYRPKGTPSTQKWTYPDVYIVEYLEEKGIIPSSSRSRSASVPSSSISSAGRRRKRPSRDIPSLPDDEQSPTSKRQRIAPVEDDTLDDDAAWDEGGPPDDFMPMEGQEMIDEGDNKENVIEVRLLEVSRRNRPTVPFCTGTSQLQERLCSTWL